MPLLNLIEKDVAELVSQYPVHSSQQEEAETLNGDAETEDKDATQ